MVLAGIECSPKIRDFRANGIPVQNRVDFFDTILIVPSVIFNRNYKRRGEYYYAGKAQKLYAYKH